MMRCDTLTVDVIYYNDESIERADTSDKKMDELAALIRDFFDADMVEVEKDEDDD